MAEVLTIGYGGRSFAQVVELLRLNSITHLVDVRSSPNSRFDQAFSRRELEAALPAHGIRYVFMGDRLGGRPAEPSCYDENGHVLYDRVAELPNFKAGIDQIQRGVSRQGTVICMLCSESKPEECHRSKLVGSALQKKGLDTIHIDEKGEWKTQDDVMQLVSGLQPQLFSEGLTSRRSYRRK